MCFGKAMKRIFLKLSWGAGEEARHAHGCRVLSGSSALGLGRLGILYHSWRSANALCCLFLKCKNSNKSRSSDSPLEGQLGLTWAFVCPPGCSPCSPPSFAEVLVGGFPFLRGARPSPEPGWPRAYLGAQIPRGGSFLLPAAGLGQGDCHTFLLELHDVGAGMCCVVQNADARWLLHLGA